MKIETIYPKAMNKLSGIHNIYLLRDDYILNIQ